MAEKQQQLVYAIIDFLRQSIDNGTVKSDDKESLEVAIQCIGEAFGVDPSNDEQAEKLSVKPATLQSIFDVFLRTRNKVGSGAQSVPPSTPKTPSPEDKAKADKLKQEGNALMSSKKYDEAIEVYTSAIGLDATNPVYYSNRAAAHSSKGDHLAAVGDAEQAIAVDPKFVKAYHRLGHAQYSLGDFQAAADAFDRGVKLDPSNASLKSGLQNARARIVPESEEAASSSQDAAARGANDTAGTSAGPAGMADMLRNMGGGGGMPDLAGIMNNPQLMAMAQQMAANGGLSGLMQDPSVANMMNRVQRGDMPSLQELMSNPALRDLANRFGAAGGRT